MSFLRNAIWFVKGLKEYTIGGFQTASKRFKPEDLDVDVTGQSFMITGANSGIGKCAALEIAKRGGTVHMVCRDPKRGEEARQEIVNTSGNENIKLHILDMSRPRAVIKFAKNFIDSDEPLNVLINNAGCMVNQRILSEDGLEKNFATNTLGTYILTVKLIPVLSKQDNARVIIVSSGGMLTQKLDTTDLQFEKMDPFDGTLAYAQNKRQQVVMAEMLAKKWPDIRFASMHPGWADTPAVQSSMPDFHRRMKEKLRTPEQGADTVVWLAISQDPMKQNGEFWQDRTVVSKYLPLSFTRASEDDQAALIKKLDEMMETFDKKVAAENS